MICVIGATGFLGSQLVHHFERQGINVFVVSSRLPVSEVLETLTNHPHKETISAILIPGASQTGADDPSAVEELVRTNVELPVAVASWMSKHVPEATLVHFGSAWQTGVGARTAPVNLYAASKSAAECLLEHFAKRGLSIFSLRLHDTYGSGDMRPKLLNRAITALKTGQPIDLSPGGQIWPLIHISDVLRAIDYSLKLPHATVTRWNIYDVGPTTQLSVRQVLEKLAFLAGIEATTVFKFGALPYRQGEIFKSEPLRLIPGWSEKVNLDNGLADALGSNRLS